jgi:hypothetical protein
MLKRVFLMREGTGRGGYYEISRLLDFLKNTDDISISYPRDRVAVLHLPGGAAIQFETDEMGNPLGIVPIR